MSGRILLCTDLDRTLLPNGLQPESPGARERLRSFVANPESTLAYVSGRHRALVEEAIAQWELPRPDWVISDVGTVLWQVNTAGDWSADEDWSQAIDKDWCGRSSADLAECLARFTELELQPPAQQNRHKLSYFLPADADTELLTRRLLEHLAPLNVRARLVFSIDETQDQGLLDVLPESASKRHAIEALTAKLGLVRENTVFCGDSGNDLEVLASPIPAVLVANATDEVRQQARALARAAGHEDQLYLARGQFLGMNGNYAAGILEGVAHYHPQTIDWMDDGMAA